MFRDTNHGGKIIKSGGLCSIDVSLCTRACSLALCISVFGTM